MLGDEDRVAAHRRLPAVVLRRGRRQSLFDELPAMLQNHRQRFFGQIGLLFRAQTKPAAKLASR